MALFVLLFPKPSYAHSPWFPFPKQLFLLPGKARIPLTKMSLVWDSLTYIHPLNGVPKCTSLTWNKILGHKQTNKQTTRMPGRGENWKWLWLRDIPFNRTMRIDPCLPDLNRVISVLGAGPSSTLVYCENEKYLFLFVKAICLHKKKLWKMWTPPQIWEYTYSRCLCLCVSLCLCLFLTHIRYILFGKLSIIL